MLAKLIGVIWYRQNPLETEGLVYRHKPMGGIIQTAKERA